jgi:hypothetical protein
MLNRIQLADTTTDNEQKDDDLFVRQDSSKPAVQATPAVGSSVLKPC